MAIDSLWSNVTLLLPCSADLLDVKGHTVTVNGGAALSSAQAPAGCTSSIALDGNNDYLVVSSPLDALGAGDWAIEIPVYRSGDTVSGTGNAASILDFRTSDTQAAIQIYLYGSTSAQPNKVAVYINGADRIVSSTALSSSFKLITLAKVSGTLRLFFDGVQEGSSYTDSNTYSTTSLTIGGRYAGLSGDFRSLNGYIGPIRITFGNGRGYSSAFSPPSLPFPRPTISGVVLNSSAAPVEKTILVVDRSSQRMLGGTTSSPSTGAYLFYPPDFGECEVKRLDEVCDPPTHEAVFSFDCRGKPGGLIHTDHLGTLVSWYGDAKLDSQGASVRLDGSGDRIEATPPNLRLGTHDFSIDLHFLPVGGGGGTSYCRILAIGANDTSGSLYIIRNATDNPMTFRFETYSGGSYTTILDYVATTVSNAWHKLQLRRTNGVLSAYVDGTLYATKACTVDFTGTTIAVGGRVGGPEYFDCNIGAVRVSKGPIRGATTIPSATLLSMPADGGSGENALIYDRVIPG